MRLTGGFSSGQRTRRDRQGGDVEASRPRIQVGSEWEGVRAADPACAEHTLGRTALFLTDHSPRAKLPGFDGLGWCLEAVDETVFALDPQWHPAISSRTQLCMAAVVVRPQTEHHQNRDESEMTAAPALPSLEAPGSGSWRGAGARCGLEARCCVAVPELSASSAALGLVHP